MIPWLVGAAIFFQAGTAGGQFGFGNLNRKKSSQANATDSVSFEGYRVPLSGGWSGIVVGGRLVLKPRVPGIWLEMERIASGGFAPRAFYQSPVGALLLKEYGRGPDPSFDPHSGRRYDFLRSSWDPDASGRVRAEYATVVFFPRSTLVARVHFFSKISAQMRRLAVDCPLMVQHTSENPTAKDAEAKNRRVGHV